MNAHSIGRMFEAINEKWMKNWILGIYARAMHTNALILHNADGEKTNPVIRQSMHVLYQTSFRKIFKSFLDAIYHWSSCCMPNTKFKQNGNENENYENIIRNDITHFFLSKQ